MSVTMPETTETRAAMVFAYREALSALVVDATRTIGDLEDADDVVAAIVAGVAQDQPEMPDDVASAVHIADEAFRAVPVVTRRAVDEAIAAVFGQAIPAPDATWAEVRTPATIVVSAVCPRCHLPQPILVSISPELVISDDDSEIKVKAKAKGRTHICGQLPLQITPDAEGQQELPLEGEITADPDDCPFPGCGLLAEPEGDHDLGGAVEAEPEGEDDEPEGDSLAGLPL